MEATQDNPYAAPLESGFVEPMRKDFVDLDTKALKKLRNDSHSLRTVAALLILGILILGTLLIISITSGTIGFAELTLLTGLLAFQSTTAVGLILRPGWGRVMGFISGALMLIGFPVGTLIGIMFLIALTRGERLFGPGRFTHKSLEAEWKYRRKFKVK